MDINLTTPALLFPTISLLMLAYTNRFLAPANLIRDLHAKYKASRDPIIIAQIANLRYRVILIRNMQGLGVVSLILCVICMFVLFADWALAGKVQAYLARPSSSGPRPAVSVIHEYVD